MRQDNKKTTENERKMVKKVRNRGIGGRPLIGGVPTTQNQLFDL